MNAINPDDISAGFVATPVSAARYSYAPVSQHDVPSLIASRIPKGARVLDVGCGTGATIEAYRKMVDCKVLGIEPDAERAKIAISRGIETITGFYQDETNHEHGPFDAIVFADVLEHLSNPASLLAIAIKGLSDNGAIIVSIPNVAHWTVRASLALGKFEYAPVGIMDATHLRWFTKNSATRFFERLDLRVDFVGASVNALLPAYNRLPPTRWMSPSMRERVLMPLVKMKPSLFGCQLVFALRPRGKKSKTTSHE